MKWLLIFFAVLLTGCTSCKIDSIANETKQIDQFSDQLFKLLLDKNVSAYMKLWPTERDQWMNVNTRKPSEVPVKQDEAERRKQEGEQAFKDVVAKIEAELGGMSDINFEEIQYWIAKDPWAKKFGLFRFSATLNLERKGKRIHVEQTGCVLSMRGILVGEPLVITDSEIKKDRED